MFGLPCDKQKERSINRLGVTHTARPTGGLTVNENRIGITTPVSGIAPGVFGTGRQSIGLDPPAKAIGGLDVLAKIDLVRTSAQPEGLRAIAIETARNGAIGIDGSRVEHHPPSGLRQRHGRGHR